MDSLKSYFRYRLERFKGRTLDSKTITMLVGGLEDEFINFMGNEGFHLKNTGSGAVIKADGVEKTFCVKFWGESEKEYKTFANACRASERE